MSYNSYLCCRLYVGGGCLSPGGGPYGYGLICEKRSTKTKIVKFCYREEIIYGHRLLYYTEIPLVIDLLHKK